MIGDETRPLPQGEDFPDVTGMRYQALSRAMSRTARLLAGHFRAFAVLIASRAEQLAAEMRSRQLDEYSDAIERSMSIEITALGLELTRTLRGTLEPVLQLGGDDASREPAFKGLQVAFDLERPDVERWLEEHALELVRGLNQTTRDELAGVLRRGVRDGMSIEQIRDAILEKAKGMSQARARLIAQTEVITAYSQGKLQYYKASGMVPRKRWVDGQFGACPQCRALHGIVVPLDATFPGGLQGPAAHPGCRCTLTAHMDGIDEDTTDAA